MRRRGLLGALDERHPARGRPLALRRRRGDAHRPERARRGGDHRPLVRHPRARRASTRASRSATRSRSARRASSCPASGSIRTRRSSPARSLREPDLGVARDSALFGKDGVPGLVNVDLTPEIASPAAARSGRAEARRPHRREPRGAGACRMIERGADPGPQLDRRQRLRPADHALAVAPARAEGETTTRPAAIGASAAIPRSCQIRFYEPPGIQVTPALQKEIEKHFVRGELRRVGGADVGECRTRRGCGRATRPTCCPPRRRRDPPRAASGSSSTTATRRPRSCSARPGPARGRGGPATASRAAAGRRAPISESIGPGEGARVRGRRRSRRRLRPRRERLCLIDESGREIPSSRHCCCSSASSARSGGRGRSLPITVTSHVDARRGRRLEIVRSRLARRPDEGAAEDGVIFAGAVGGGYVFPDFLPAYDAVASLCKLLELLAPVRRPLSTLVAELPSPTLIHRQSLPLGAQGARDARPHRRAQGPGPRPHRRGQGLRRAGWVQVLPDPGRAAPSTSTPRATTSGLRASSRPSLRSLVGECMQRCQEVEVSS